MWREKGIVNLLMAAIAIPVLALLGAAALDFVRIPLTRNLSHAAVSKIISNTIPYPECDGYNDTSSSPKAQYGPMGGDATGLGGACDVWSTLEGFVPSAHNFCFLTESTKSYNQQLGADAGGGCKPLTVNNGFLTHPQAKKLSDVYANSIYQDLVKTTSSWPYEINPNNIYVEVSYARALYDPSGVFSVDECPFGGLGSIGTAGVAALTEMGSTQNLVLLSTTDVNAAVCGKFTQIATGTRGWKVERCSGDKVTGNCAGFWLPSYWMVVAVNIRLDSYLGGLAWPEAANGESYYIVRDWTIVPHLNIAGIEKTELSSGP